MDEQLENTELTPSQRLEAARLELRKVARAAARMAEEVTPSVDDRKFLPTAFKTVSAALGTKLGTLCIVAAEVDALAAQLTDAWADCLNESVQGY